MIEQTIVEGRPATVAYLTSDFEPCAPIDADLIKVMFDNGRVVFAVPATPAVEKWDESKHPRGKTSERSTEGSFKPAGDVGVGGEEGAAKPKAGEQAAAGETAAEGKGKKEKPKLLKPEAIYDDMSTKKAEVVQPLSDLDQLYEQAKKDEPAFVQDLDTLAETTGGEAIYPPKDTVDPGSRTMKNRARASEKVEKEYKGDASKIADVVRGTIKHPTVFESREAAALFIQNMGDRIVRVKDRFANPMSGYRDILINHKTDSGLIAETLFGTENTLKLKFGRGHKIYEELRTLPASSRERRRLMDLSENLYNTAYELDGNGTWGQRAVRT